MLKQTHDFVHEYDGHNPDIDHKGRCRIRIFTRERGAPVIVCSALPGARGLSITNGVEYIAGAVIRRFLPEIFPRMDEPPIWIEHYPNSPRYGNVRPRVWKLVRFDDWWPRPEWVAGRLRIRTGVPHWTLVEREQIEEMLGERLPV